MDEEKILNLLNHASEKDWVISFDDGDRYHMSSLDVHSDFLDPYGEIDVQFEDCLSKSLAFQSASASSGTKIPNIWYAEKGSGPPVGKTYCVREVVAIFDNDKNYFVFERGT